MYFAEGLQWINETDKYPYRFEWQEGYGAFSYSKSQIDTVYHDIQNQEAHHCTQSFREEYLDILDKFDVDYDSRYIFEIPTDR